MEQKRIATKKKTKKKHPPKRKKNRQIPRASQEELVGGRDGNTPRDRTISAIKISVGVGLGVRRLWVASASPSG